MCGLHQGSERNSALFEAWLNCTGDWAKSSLYINCKSSHSSVRKGVRRWMTRQEVVGRFGESAAEAIILRKLGDPTLSVSECRRHPELPDSVDLMQFLILDTEVQVDKEEDLMQILCKAAESANDNETSSSGSSGSSKKTKKKQRKTRRHSASNP